ncbi:MAG: pre-toxin TG domain-containing protein [Lacunisphaera sp.]
MLRTGASAGAGFIPGVGEIQSWVELVSGKDYITGQPASRWLAGAGVVLGMVDLSGLTKAGKIAKGAEELLKDARKLSPGELKALVGDIHSAKDIIKQDAELAKALRGENFDILVDKAGNAVLKTNNTGRLIPTGVPPSAFHP